MAYKINPEKVFSQLMKSYGMFVEQPTYMDMVLEKQETVEGLTVKVKFAFMVGVFWMEAGIEVTVFDSKKVDDIVDHILRIQHRKKSLTYPVYEKPSTILSKGAVQNIILRYMKATEPDYYYNKREVARWLTRGVSFDASGMLQAFYVHTKGLPYTVWSLNNQRNPLVFESYIAMNTGVKLPMLAIDLTRPPAINQRQIENNLHQRALEHQQLFIYKR